MSSRFEEMRDELFDVVDEEFAEPIRLAFLTNGLADAARPSVDIEALLRTGKEAAAQPDGGTNSSWKIKFAAATAVLSIDRNAWPDIQIADNDKVRALSRPGQPWFEVLHVDDRSHRRLIVFLGEV